MGETRSCHAVAPQGMLIDNGFVVDLMFEFFFHCSTRFGEIHGVGSHPKVQVKFRMR
jgi:hypothetical protein